MSISGTGKEKDHAEETCRRPYVARIDEEIARVEKGAAPPAGATREAYLKDLESRRYEVRMTISGREIMRQDERRQSLELQRPLP